MEDWQALGTPVQQQPEEEWRSLGTPMAAAPQEVEEDWQTLGTPVEEQAPAQEQGFFGQLADSALGGTERFISSSRTGFDAVTGNAASAALSGLERGDELDKKYTSAVDVNKVKEAYASGGLWAATQAVLGMIPHALAEQAPMIATSIAGARVGAMAGLPLGPKGVLGGAILGGVGALLPQYIGNNVERQAEAQIDAGQEVDPNVGLATATGVAQAGLDFVSLKMMGGGLVTRWMGMPTKTAQEQLVAAAKRSLLATTARGAAKGTAEIPTEVAQQILERAQAGLPLLNDEALAEYGQAAFGAALIGPTIGGVAHVGERRHARKKLDAQAKADDTLSGLDTPPPAREPSPMPEGEVPQRQMELDLEGPARTPYDQAAHTPDPNTPRDLLGDPLPQEEAPHARPHELWSLADDSSLPPNDGGSRPVGTDGTPLRGMAEDVPTLDFPLRQEVLDSAGGREATDIGANAVGEVRAAEARIQKAVDKQAEFLADYEGSPQAMAAEHAKLEALTDQLDQAQQKRQAVEQAVLDAYKAVGIHTAMDAYGRPIYDRQKGRGIPVRHGHDARKHSFENRSGKYDVSYKDTVPLKRHSNGDINWRQTLKQIFNDPKKRSKFPGVDKLISKLLDVLPDDLIVRLVDKISDKGEHGQYRPMTNKVLIVREGRNSYVLLHELVHAATSRFIEMHPNHPLVKELNKIYDLALSKIKEAKEHYGLKDNHEFLSEAFNNPKFQAELKRIKVGEKNLWGRFKAWLQRVIGVDSSYDITALDKALELGTQIMDKQAKDQGRAKKYYEAKRARALTIEEAYHNAPPPGLEEAQELQTEMERAAKLVSDPTSQQQSVLAGVGIEVDLIGKDPEVSPELLDTIAEEGDVGGSNWFQAGAQAKANINSSTAVRTIYRWWDNAIKRAERFDRDYVRPASHLLNQVFRKDADVLILKGIFDREIANDKEFTAEQLRDAGISDKLIETYELIRRMHTAALDAMNATRRAKGKPDITRKEAYMSARWQGPWRATITTTVVDEKGNKHEKVIWQVHEGSRNAANKAVEWIKQDLERNGIEAKITKVKYQESSSRLNPDLQAGYLEMLDLLDVNDERVFHIKQLLESSAAMNTVNIHGQERHFKKKTGVRGFMGDRPWADPASDAKEFFKQQLQYAKNGFEWAEKQGAAQKVKKLFADERVAQLDNLVNWGKIYSQLHMGYGTNKHIQGIENAIAKSLGISPRHMDQTLGISKSAFYLAKLGFFNQPFVASQIIQPLFSAPYHSMLTAEGYKHSAALSIVESGKGASAYMLYHLNIAYGTEAGAQKALGMMSQVQREAALYSDQNGVVDINPLTDVADLNVPDGLRTARDIAGWSIKYSEQLARSAAFFSFVSHLEQSGKFPNTREGRLEMFRMAEDATKFTMVDYRPSERALVFHRFGLAGNAAATFRAFMINQLNQGLKYSQYFLEGIKEGNPRKLVPAMQFYGLYYLFGGLSGFIGLDDADFLWELLKSMVPSEHMPSWAREWSPKKAIVSSGEMISAGPVSVMTGSDLYRRFNSAQTLPLEPSVAASFGQLFPHAAWLVEQGGGLANLLGDPSERAAGVHTLAPTSMKGLVENYYPGFTTEGGVVGKQKDPAFGDYTRTEGEKTARNFGFRSIKEATTRDRNFMAERVDRDFERRRNEISKSIKNHFALGSSKNLEKSLNAYYEMGGDLQTLLTDRAIQDAIIAKNTDKLTKMSTAAQTGNHTKVQELLRYLELLNK